MSAAQNCPLVYQLNALQVQPLQHHMSHDTALNPDDFVPSPFDCNKPDPPTPDPEPPPLQLSQDTNFDDAYASPVAPTVQI